MIPARRSESVMRFFDVYVRRYVGRRFDRVRLWGTPQALDVPAGLPLLCVMSHAAWWDVLIGYYLARHVIRRESYAPWTRRSSGATGSSRGSGSTRWTGPPCRVCARSSATRPRCSRRPVRMGHAQGEIVSNWKRPVRFQVGVGHLVRSAPEIAVVPVAVHYEFLEEARPEIFIRFGPRGASKPGGIAPPRLPRGWSGTSRRPWTAR